MIIDCASGQKENIKEKEPRTDGNHALAIVVEILLDNLQQALNGTAGVGICLVNGRGRNDSALCVTPKTQILVLLLHFGKGGGQATDDTLVSSVVDVGLDQKAKVEHEFIAQILCVGNDDGVAEDSVFAVWGVYCDVAVAKWLAGNDVFLEDVKVDERRAG